MYWKDQNCLKELILMFLIGYSGKTCKSTHGNLRPRMNLKVIEHQIQESHLLWKSVLMDSTLGKFSEMGGVR